MRDVVIAQELRRRRRVTETTSVYGDDLHRREGSNGKDDKDLYLWQRLAGRD